ncbi:hypothetical protein [Streptomyces sp. NPDC020681]
MRRPFDGRGEPFVVPALPYGDSPRPPNEPALESAAAAPPAA